MTIRATAQVTAVADPEMRFTPSGKGVASLRVVSNKRVKDSNGQWVDGEPSYFTAQAWDKLGDRIVENVQKGTRLLLSGRMTFEQYETKDGEKRTAVKMDVDEIALDIRFTTYRKEESGGGSGASRTADDSFPGGGYGAPVDEPPW